MARVLPTARRRLLLAASFAATALAACAATTGHGRVAVAANGAPASADSAHPIWRGIQTVAAKLTALGTKLQVSSLEWQYLAFGARQLTDPETAAPYRTSRGSPLLYWLFEPDPRARSGRPIETVLFLGGVHGDELSPLYSSFRVLLELTKDPARRPAGIRLVYVPIVNPDGLHDTFGARKNANGVDLNANLGSMSPEAETRFVIALLDRYAPTHVVSLHGPFGWVDYDGPALGPDASAADRDHVLEWTARVANASHGKLALKNEFPVSPGSLGSYAGEQRRLHVVTIELPHALAGWSEVDWADCSAAVFESLTLRPVSPVAGVSSAPSYVAPSPSVAVALLAASVDTRSR